MENGKIFISYRREDTSGESGRLKDKLEQIFGQENIFYDVETLEAGLNFDQSIAKALGESKVLLAMIGPHWLKVTDSKGVLRLQKPEDWVRKEIAEALSRNLRVIPVLVNDAEMPDPDDLPEDLKELSLKHAQELSSSRWNYDVGELAKILEKIIDKKPEAKKESIREEISKRQFVPHPPQPKSWWAKNYLWMIGGLVGFLILVGMCVPDEEYPTPVDEDQIAREELVQDAENLAAMPSTQDPRVTNPSGTEIHESLTLEDENSQPNTATINLVYTGDTFGCVLNLKFTIGGQEIIPTNNNFPVSGIPVGTQFYTIEGQITCQTGINCAGYGEGSIHVLQGGNYYLAWSTTAAGQCALELQTR